eukprot:TRINITY_DN765_c1_g1_i2.p2 TRINITY_DN765_c1_g1~~TRINITY_DN765_c1_g1_i2.p2  ORF type:complete len:100 (+),score=11.72 TRINITY_DN765_c1_g1_i2:129-428(+)
MLRYAGHRLGSVVANVTPVLVSTPGPSVSRVTKAHHEYPGLGPNPTTMGTIDQRACTSDPNLLCKWDGSEAQADCKACDCCSWNAAAASARRTVASLLA